MLSRGSPRRSRVQKNPNVRSLGGQRSPSSHHQVLRLAAQGPRSSEEEASLRDSVLNGAERGFTRTNEMTSKPEQRGWSGRGDQETGFVQPVGTCNSAGASTVDYVAPRSQPKTLPSHHAQLKGVLRARR